MDRQEVGLIAAVAARTGRTADDIKTAYYDGEDHYLTADEALAEKFIDIIEDAQAELPQNLTLVKDKIDLAAVQKAYRSFNAMAKKDGSTLPAAPAILTAIKNMLNSLTAKSKSSTTIKSKDMDTSKIAEFLGLPADATEDQIIAACENIKKKQEPAPEPPAEDALTAVLAQNAALAAKVQQLEDYLTTYGGAQVTADRFTPQDKVAELFAKYKD